MRQLSLIVKPSELEAVDPSAGQPTAAQSVYYTSNRELYATRLRCDEISFVERKFRFFFTPSVYDPGA